jgi:hypothetical protein
VIPLSSPSEDPSKADDQEILPTFLASDPKSRILVLVLGQALKKCWSTAVNREYPSPHTPVEARNSNGALIYVLE